MSAGKHTPGPWHTGDGDKQHRSSVYSANGQRIATLDDIANAERIVQCVNAHDELVAALEELLHNSNPPHSGDAAMDADFKRRYDAASARGIAAIAKATGSAA